MANLSQYLGQGGGKVRSSSLLGPGSNGFWKRVPFVIPGTYQWIAPTDGKVKIQAIGAACGGQYAAAGSSGSYGEKVLEVRSGEALNIVVGAGSMGGGRLDTFTVRSVSPGGTTSISGAPVGGTPLALLGARGDGQGGYDQIYAGQVEGRFSGPWDKAFVGAKSSQTSRPSPASASPLGPGNPASSVGSAPPGWARDGGIDSFVSGVRGYLVAGDRDSEIWDLVQAEFRYGSGAIGTGSTGTMPSRVGGGALTDSNPNGTSPPGAGGRAYTGNGSADVAGRGGDAFMWLFYDEVL